MRVRTGRTTEWGGAGSPSAPRLEEVVLRVSRDRLRQLIQLCHPDKHGNSSTSEDVTRWLLEARKKLDGR